MVEVAVKVHLESGLHARPAANFVQLASRYPCEVMLMKNEKIVNAKSILGILSLAVTTGSEVLLQTNGEREEEASSELIQFLQSGV